MCWAYSSAASTTSRPFMGASSSSQYARVAGSSLSTACGEKIGSSIRRAPLWYGGSDEIGGATPAGDSSIGGRNSLTMTLREVNRSVS
jgi:hypothetical protein